MHARPFSRSQDKPLLAAVRKQVSESLDLRGELAGHRNGLVAAAPELFAKSVHAASFPREIRVDEAHRPRELLWIERRTEQVVVVGQKHERVDLQAVESLRPAEDADDDFAQ